MPAVSYPLPMHHWEEPGSISYLIVYSALRHHMLFTMGKWNQQCQNHNSNVAATAGELTLLSADKGKDILSSNITPCHKFYYWAHTNTCYLKAVWSASFWSIFSQLEDLQLFVLFQDCGVQQQTHHTAEEIDTSFNVRGENWSFWSCSR